GGPWDQPQVIKLGGKHLYLLSFTPAFRVEKFKTSEELQWFGVTQQRVKYFVCFVLFFRDRIPLCNNPGCPGTHFCRPGWPQTH
ncbi:hypothetical protein ACQP3J_32585, partial [Escherichia coli]